MNSKILAAYAILAFAWVAEAAPTRVTNLSVIQTNDGVVLAWTVPTPSGTMLTNLDVRYSSNGPINTLNWSSNPQVEWLTDNGTPNTIQTATITSELASNTFYYFAVRTQDDSSGAESTMSNLIYIKNNGSTFSVVLAWNPDPASDNVTNYVLYFGDITNPYANQVNAGNNFQCTAPNLAHGVTYFFEATAESTNGQSAYSQQISYQN